MTIPTIAVNPAGVRAAAGDLPRVGASMAEQAGVVVRTWTGLSEVYTALEEAQLTHALDTVRTSVSLHETRLTATREPLDTFADAAERLIQRLNKLRAEASLSSRT